MADIIDGGISRTKPAQVSEEDAAAYARQQEIKAGAMGLVGGISGSAKTLVAYKGIVQKFLAALGVVQTQEGPMIARITDATVKAGQKAQLKEILQAAEKSGHSVERFRWMIPEDLWPW